VLKNDAHTKSIKEIIMISFRQERAMPDLLLGSLFAVFVQEPMEILTQVPVLDLQFCTCGIFLGKEKDSCEEGLIYIMDSTFESYVYKSKSDPEAYHNYERVSFAQKHLTFVQIKNVSSEEIERISKICNACCNLKIKYNYKDRFMSAFTNPPDNTDIYNTQYLHSAQAVLLIIREGLDPHSHNNNNNNNSQTSSSSIIKKRLKEINSRATYPTLLHRELTAAIAEAGDLQN